MFGAYFKTCIVLTSQEADLGSQVREYLSNESSKKLAVTSTLGEMGGHEQTAKCLDGVIIMILHLLPLRVHPPCEALLPKVQTGGYHLDTAFLQSIVNDTLVLFDLKESTEK